MKNTLLKLSLLRWKFESAFWRTLFPKSLGNPHSIIGANWRVCEYNRLKVEDKLGLDEFGLFGKLYSVSPRRYYPPPSDEDYKTDYPEKYRP